MSMWKLAVISVVASLMGMFQIYNAAVVNNLYPAASPWLNEQFDNDMATVGWQWALLCGTPSIGMIFGTMFSSEFADRLGRTNSLCLASLVISLAGLVSGLVTVADSIYLATVGRLVIGLAMGVSINSASLLLSETPPKAYRGRFVAINPIFFSLGDFGGLLIALPVLLGTENLWPLAMVFACLPGPVCLLVLLFTPESPRYLALKDGHISVRAIKSILWFQGSKYVEETADEITEEISELEKNPKISYRQLFCGPTLRPLLLTVFLNVTDQMTGIGVVLIYSTIILQAGGMSFASAAYCTLALGVVKCLSNFPVPYFLDMWGRRPAILFGLLGCLVSNTIATICLATRTPGVVAVSFAFYMAFFSFNDSAIFVVSMELFMQSSRGKAFTVAMVARWIVSAFQALFYLPILIAIGPCLSLLPFVIYSILALPIVYKFVPETTNRTFLDIVESSFGGEKSFENPNYAEKKPIFKNQKKPVYHNGSITPLGEDKEMVF